MGKHHFFTFCSDKTLYLLFRFLYLLFRFLYFVFNVSYFFCISCFSRYSNAIYSSICSRLYPHCSVEMMVKSSMRVTSFSFIYRIHLLIEKPRSHLSENATLLYVYELINKYNSSYQGVSSNNAVNLRRNHKNSQEITWLYKKHPKIF